MDYDQGKGSEEGTASLSFGPPTSTTVLFFVSLICVRAFDVSFLLLKYMDTM